MKLTPMDIHHKEFRHSIRGYAEEEVDEFLDAVADELERVIKENIDLNERLEAADAKVRSYVDMEKTLHNTMVSAQQSAEGILEKARREAEGVLKDAEVKAKDIIHNALSDKQRVQQQLLRIKHAEEEFRTKYKAVLEERLSNLHEIALPEDVKVVLGQAGDEVVGEVEVDTPQAPAYRPEAAQPAAAQPPVPQQAAMEIEPPDSGFATSLQLGEVRSPDLGPAEPEYGEPAEFSVPGGSALGEREADDIEEID